MRRFVSAAIVATLLGAATAAGAASRPVPGARRPAARLAREKARSSTATAHLGYWGGRLVRNAHVVVVLWGSGRFATGVNTASAPNVSSFFGGVLQSPYVDWLREYNTKLDSIGRGGFVKKYAITPAAKNNGTRIDDRTNIRVELLAQLRAHHLPGPDANTIYALFFRSGQIVTQGGLDSATGFCAYHGTAKWSASLNVRYLVLPATATGSHCGPAAGFGNLTIAASHEVAETITDPDVGLATRLAPPLSWYDPVQGEIADICQGRTVVVRAGDGRNYVVQKLWSNRRRACVAG